MNGMNKHDQSSFSAKTVTLTFRRWRWSGLSGKSKQLKTRHGCIRRKSRFNPSLLVARRAKKWQKLAASSKSTAAKKPLPVKRPKRRNKRKRTRHGAMKKNLKRNCSLRAARKSAT